MTYFLIALIICFIYYCIKAHVDCKNRMARQHEGWDHDHPQPPKEDRTVQIHSPYRRGSSTGVDQSAPVKSGETLADQF